jgi:hypothetical protein
MRAKHVAKAARAWRGYRGMTIIERIILGIAGDYFVAGK